MRRETAGTYELQGSASASAFTASTPGARAAYTAACAASAGGGGGGTARALRRAPVRRRVYCTAPAPTTATPTSATAAMGPGDREASPSLAEEAPRGPDMGEGS